MIFAIQYDEESGYCDNIQQAVGARDTYGGWDEVKPASDFVDYYQNGDGTEFKWSQVTGLENWDQLTPKQRAVFFCRDGLKSNAKLASQKPRRSASADRTSSTATTSTTATRPGSRPPTTTATRGSSRRSSRLTSRWTVSVRDSTATRT